MTTVWITGARGFIGRNLARFLNSQGCKVLGVGHGAWPKEMAGKWGISFWLNGEIEAPNLRQLLDHAGPPEIVYHLAGGSAVGPSFQSPLEDFRRTADTTASLFSWIKNYIPKCKTICVSSAAVYGNGHSGRIPETVVVTPYSPYGFHKAIMEMLCQSYAKNFGIKIAVVRLFSVYGPGLEKQLLWDICSKLAAGHSPVRLGGSGREVRDWINVSDAARLLWFSKELCDTKCAVINGGTGLGTDVSQIAAHVFEEWGETSLPVFSGQKRLGDPESLVADTSRAKRLGFTPEVPLTRGIAEVVEWFKSIVENE